MNEQPPLERVADLIYEWAIDEDIEKDAAEELADSVQDLCREAINNK